MNGNQTRLAVSIIILIALGVLAWYGVTQIDRNKSAVVEEQEAPLSPEEEKTALENLTPPNTPESPESEQEVLDKLSAPESGSGLDKEEEQEILRSLSN